MHSGLFVLGFDVPEVPEYFISKFVIVAITTAVVIHKIGYKVKAVAIASIAGSSVFSLYYFLTRPNIFNLGSGEYEIYDLQTSFVIWLVHTIAIFVGFIFVMRYRQKGRKNWLK